MGICLIFNPAARGEGARRFRRQLESIGSQCVLKPTAQPGDGRMLAREAVLEGHETLVAAGGDGTVNEVVNGIGDTPDGFSRARLAVLPLGTINVFAREMGIPLRIDRAWGVIQQGRSVALDLPRVEFDTDTGPATRHFVQLAGAGFDAEAVERVDWNLKKRIGFGAYLTAACAAMKHRRPVIDAKMRGRAVSGELVLIGNGRYYGGPFKAFPHADPRDGLLDLCIYPKVTWSTVTACLWGIATGRLARMGGARHSQSEFIHLTSSRRTPLQLDGECVGQLPARFSVRKAGLSVIVA